MFNRFLVLAGSDYYPAGWHDYRQTFNTEEEAIAFAEEYVRPEPYRWAEVVRLDVLEHEHVMFRKIGFCRSPHSREEKRKLYERAVYKLIQGVTKGEE